MMGTDSWVWDFGAVSNLGGGNAFQPGDMRRVGGSDLLESKKSVGSMRQSLGGDEEKQQPRKTTKSSGRSKQGGALGRRQGFQDNGIEMLPWQSSLWPTGQTPQQGSPDMGSGAGSNMESDGQMSPGHAVPAQGSVSENVGDAVPSRRPDREASDQSLLQEPGSSINQSLHFNRMDGSRLGHLANSFDSWSASHRFTGLDSKLVESHWTLQNYYHGHEDTVQHRLAHRISQLGGSWVDWARVTDS